MTRLKYPQTAPEGYAALSAFGHYVNSHTALEPVLLGLVYLRASALNGCHFCVEAHKEELRRHHEPESRIEAAMTAPESDAFTPREQAVLRWTTVLTRLAGQEIADAEYEAIAHFFGAKDLVDLSFAIANINAWNRMGVAFQPRWHAPAERNGDVPQEDPKAVETATTFPTATMPATVSAQQPGTIAGETVDDDGGKVAFD